MPEIEDYAVYNDRMRRSMWDKAFFMDKVPGAELIVDWGCADGSLIRFLHGLFPSVRFIGYDIDGEMVRRARAQRQEGTWFFTDIGEALGQIARLGLDGSRTAVNFSSVFHEIFHYRADPGPLARLLAELKPAYLTVRDMEYVNPAGDESVSAGALARARSLLPGSMIRDFERAHGPISVRKNLVHLLLKFRYVENWPRECEENYFSYTREDLLGLLDPEKAFRPIYDCRYFLPWCRWDIERAVQLDLGDSLTTHFSLILRRDGAECVRV